MTPGEEGIQAARAEGKSLGEREHAKRAWGLRQVFTTEEQLAEFLHQNYRATAKSLGSTSCDHGWSGCHNKKYFWNRARYLTTDYPFHNGRVPS